MNYKELIKEVIDLHVHVGPEIIPRKFTLPELIRAEKGKIKAIGIKSHFFPTIAMNTSKTLSSESPFIINSVTLNNYQGGFNSDIIRAGAELSGDRPILVWFPTLHTTQFLQNNKYEIAPEWIDEKKRSMIELKKASTIKPLSIFKNGEISDDVKNVLETIKKYGSILCTGHISWQESEKLVECAVKKYKIKKIIVTHPIYQKIKMPLDVQKKLAALGAYIEHCYSMYSIDKISIKEIADQIRFVGVESCILSSDVGQAFSPNPSEAMEIFLRLLEAEKFSFAELKKIACMNQLNLIREIH